MKTRKLLLALAASALLASCSLFPTKSGVSSTSSTEEEANVEDANNYDQDIAEDITEDGDDNDFDNVVIEDENVEIPESYDSFSDNKITDAGKYYLSGSYPFINITAAANSEVFVFLDGINISYNEGIAFASKNAIVLHVVLLNNSTNSIVNDCEDTNAFHVKGNVLISGSGTLNLESKQKSALKVSKDLYVYSGVTINATGYGHAITARSFTSKGAKLNLYSSTKDGINCEVDSDVSSYTTAQGYAYLVDTTLVSETYGDGIQADTYVYVNGGKLNIVTHGQFVSYSSENMSTYNLTQDDYKFVKSGDTYKHGGERITLSSAYALANSVKGIKVGPIEYSSADITTGDYLIYIAHLASVTVNSPDDCIHTNYGNVKVENSNLELATLDDGIHADYDSIVNNASIGISSSYEGIEGGNVTVDGEKTNIVAYSDDDGINAASNYTSSNIININNCEFLRVYASGDGIDANTALNLNGGTVIVEGPGQSNGSLDAEKVNFNGGFVFACSTGGMKENMSATQCTFFVQKDTTLSSDSKISVVDSENKALFSYTLKQSCNQIIFSHPDMALYQSYKVLNGSSTFATITMSSKLVVSGSQGGGPGGPR